MILGIDTSTGTAVAVVTRDGEVLADVRSDDPLRHAEVIGELIARALAESAVGREQITHVAAGMGPGPFTGLRVGIAAARTFALGRGISLVPVPSHDAVALELLLYDALVDAGAERDDEGEAFAVVTDARRREMAYSIYRGIDDDGLPVPLAPAALAPRAEIDRVLADAAVLRRDAGAISAAMLAVCAGRAIAAGRQLADAQPLYLRAPDVTLRETPKKVGA